MLTENLLRLKFCVFLFFFFITSFSAQNPDNYNLIYTKTYLETSQKDFKKALQIADSLYQISETPKFKAKSLMLTATLLQQSGDLKKAVEYALKAEVIVVDSEDYLWQAKVNGFLSSQYRNLGLFDQSKKYIQKSLKSIEKLDNKEMVNNMTGFVMQEKAYYEIEFKYYHKAVDLIKKSHNYFIRAGNKEAFLTATNMQLLGFCHVKTGDYDKALQAYNNAKKILDEMPDNFLKGLVYNGIAQVYIGKHDLDRAKEYMVKAENIAKESNYLSLKNEIYTTSQQYYLATKDLEKLKDITNKKDSAVEKMGKNTAAFISKEYSDLEQKNTISEQKSVGKSYILTIVIALCILFVIAMVIHKKRQKQKLKTANKLLHEVKYNYLKLETQIEENKQLLVITKDIEDDSEQSPMMTPATEKKLLAKLNKFEKSTLYTRNAVSLPYLASYCETNTKYLSYIINNFKQKDFNNYINELRINYIIEKLKTDSKYQKYKIATLADEAGFSSQSKFASAFKKVTNISPSIFLQTLKNSDYS